MKPTTEQLIEALRKAIIVAERRGDELAEEGVDCTMGEILLKQSREIYWSAIGENPCTA